jgi:hypothetical protein
MRAISSVLHERVVGVAPIIGVSIGRRDDKSTWRIDFAPEATQTQRDAAAGVVASFDAAAVESAEQAETAAVDALEGETRSDAVFAALRTATAAEINTFINNTFPAMTAQQRAVLKLLLRFTAVRLRRDSRK